MYFNYGSYVTLKVVTKMNSSQLQRSLVLCTGLPTVKSSVALGMDTFPPCWTGLHIFPMTMLPCGDQVLTLNIRGPCCRVEMMQLSHPGCPHGPLGSGQDSPAAQKTLPWPRKAAEGAGVGQKWESEVLGPEQNSGSTAWHSGAHS